MTIEIWLCLIVSLLIAVVWTPWWIKGTRFRYRESHLSHEEYLKRYRHLMIGDVPDPVTGRWSTARDWKESGYTWPTESDDKQ